MSIVVWAVVFWLVILCVRDLTDHVLPNRWTMPACVGAVTMGVLEPHVGMSIGVLCAPYVVAVAVGACGGGDLKLAVGLGGVVADPTRAILVVLLAAVVTIAVAPTRRGRRRGEGIAHGPALAAAAIVVGGVTF